MKCPTQFFCTLRDGIGADNKKQVLPQFPEFKNIEWADKAAVEQLTNVFPPYSDFNFTSIWSWNTREKMKLCQLNGNLVLLFYDYITEEPFLSFIGKNMLAETANSLIDYSMQKFRVPYLKLIPEIVAAELCPEQFEIIPDADSHDYILSAPSLQDLGNFSNSAHPAARRYKQYLQLYPKHTVRTFSGKDIPVDKCIALFKQWAKVKCLDYLELNEYGAFVRFIQNPECASTIVSIYEGDTLLAFGAYEIVSREYAMGHFLKADNSFRGINEAVHVRLCERLWEKNICYWNYEQDLGIPQLRQAKKKYKPVFYLKKFIVRKHSRSLTFSVPP